MNNAAEKETNLQLQDVGREIQDSRCSCTSLQCEKHMTAWTRGWKQSVQETNMDHKLCTL